MFTDVIKKLCIYRGISQMKLAERLGCSRATLSRKLQNGNLTENSIFEIMKQMDAEIIVRVKDGDTTVDFPVRKD